MGAYDLTAINAEDIDGTRNTVATDNNSYGFTAQLVHLDFFNECENEFIIGIGADKARIDFASDSEFAIRHNDTIHDDRSVGAISFFDYESTVCLHLDSQSFLEQLVSNQGDALCCDRA